MATITGKTSSSLWTFKLEVTEGTPNVANNTSPVTVEAYIGRASTAGSSYMYGASISVPVSVTGAGSRTITYKNANKVTVSAGGWLKLGSTTFSAVPHNADGSKTVTVSATFTNNVTPSSGSASGSFTLTTIARASQPSCITWPEHTQNVGNFGDTISIHMNRKSDSFTHTVRYAFGTLSGNIATGVTTGTTWTIPLSFMDLIPAATSGSGTIYVDTYNGTTKIGTKSCGFTATVPASIKPTCSIQVLDATDIKDTYGNLVQSQSKLYVKTTGTPAYSSPIASYKVIANGVEYTSAEITTGVLIDSGTTTVTATVTDKRGRTSAADSASFPVLAYTRPSISSLSVHRCAQDGTEDSEGDYAQVTFSAAVTPLNNKNTATYRLRYGQSTNNLTTVNLSTLTGDYVVTDYSYIFAADSEFSYVIEVEVKDSFHTTTQPTSVSTAFSLMDWHESGTGIRFGGVAEEVHTLQNDLALKQTGNRYAFSTPGTAGASGYVCMAQLTHVAENADSPLTFVFTRRLEATPMMVHVQFRTDSTTVDPELKGITYEGSNYGAFLVKLDTSVWGLYVQKVSAYDTITLQDWYSSKTIKGRLNVTFPGTIVTTVPTPFYRATPAKLQSLLDYIYPVGSIYLSYSQVSPADLFGGTWERIVNRFLWGCDAEGDIGVVGGEKTHKLTVNELPSHTHGSVYSQHASGTKDKAWYTTSGSSVAYGTVATGGGAEHNNMPPYIQVAIWRRTA